MKKPKYKLRTYRIRIYDVWGNARGGFEVNDVRTVGTTEPIKCKREIFNAGTPHEFDTYEPTGRQLSRAAGFSRVKWDGEPGGTYKGAPYGGRYTADDSRNGRPIGELIEVIEGE